MKSHSQKSAKESGEPVAGASSGWADYARVALPFLSAMLAVFLWAMVKVWYRLPAYQLPGPGEVWHAALQERVLLWQSALTTFNGALQGFAAAVVVGFALAVALGSSRLARWMLYPHVLLLQMMPVVVLAPVLVIWLGPGLPSVRVITFLIGFFPIVANTTQGLISTDAHMVDLFNMYNASRWQELMLLRVPHALPYMLTGARIAGSLAMIGAIAGEFFAGNSAGGAGGLGFRVLVYNAQLKIPALFATGFLACLGGLIFVSAVHGLNWLLLRKWHDSIARRDH